MIRPEWSHVIRTEHITSDPASISLKASEQECRDLARRFKIMEISNLKADVILQRQLNSNLVQVSGSVTGQVTQACVISAKPVIYEISESFADWFSEEDDVVSLSRVRRDRLNQMIDGDMPVLDDEEDPEPVENGEIDVAEIVVQHVSLALDPYPRAADAMPAVPVAEEGAETGAKRPNPFEGLKNLRLKAEKET